MEQNLFDSFKEIEDSYYSIAIEPEKLFPVQNNMNKCCAFIRSHFQHGRKAKALDFPFENEYIENGKHQHTVALYLLGLHLKERFEEGIKADLQKKITGLNKWYDFKYTWYLTSLYHDAASCAENTSRTPELHLWMDENDIWCTPYEYCPCKHGVSLTRFDFKLIANYYRYRAEACQVQEHGITGGLLLFDKLKKNFDKKTEEKQWNWSKHNEHHDNGLSWRRTHLDHFAYIADAIICHNLWMAHDKDVQKVYREHGLEPLIITDKNSRLSRVDYPLQYMLCLLDTIEPVKRFNDLSPREVLENVSIQMPSSEIEIRWTDRIKQSSGFHKWLDNIYEMNQWLGVTVSPCHREGDLCYVKISF